MLRENLDTSGEDGTDPDVAGKSASDKAAAGAPTRKGVLEPGDVVRDQFEIVRPLGRGGMGVVYEARDRVTGAQLALKTILPVHLSNPRAVERFIQEINASRRLSHPNVVSVFDVAQDGAQLFFTMEFLKGLSLRALIKQRKQLDLETTVRIVRQLCNALEYAHQFMIHRDLSPENVMVLENGTVKLLDFGLARMLDRRTMTATGASLGKAHYMSPEQRKSAARVDHRTDLYALGVMIFEMLTGVLPLGVERLADLRPDLPRKCDALVARCLAPAERRFGTAAELRVALEDCLVPEASRTISLEATGEEVRAREAAMVRQAAEQVRIRQESAARETHAAAQALATARALSDLDINPSHAVARPLQQAAKSRLRTFFENLTDTAGDFLSSAMIFLKPLLAIVAAGLVVWGLYAVMSAPPSASPASEGPATWLSGVSQTPTDDGLAKVQQAVRQYFTMYGAYPPSLSDLVPAYLPDMTAAELSAKFAYDAQEGKVYPSDGKPRSSPASSRTSRSPSPRTTYTRPAYAPSPSSQQSVTPSLAGTKWTGREEYTRTKLEETSSSSRSKYLRLDGKGLAEVEVAETTESTYIFYPEGRLKHNTSLGVSLGGAWRQDGSRVYMEMIPKRPGGSFRARYTGTLDDSDTSGSNGYVLRGTAEDSQGHTWTWAALPSS